MTRILGLDYGERRVGVAISDPMCMLATPVETLLITGMNNAVEQVAAIVVAREIDKILVGLPLNMNNTKGEIALLCEKFAGKLAKATGREIIMWDERMTSMAAKRVLLAADVSRAKRKKVIDKMAAQILLQSYLDAQTI
ncbi:MAG: putative Holliday junction resolvase [Kiritimatiellia bacterium]|jgi:putative holliday junction resolvase